MWTSESQVAELDSAECRALLRSAGVARLAVAVRDEVEIFPVTIAADQEGRYVFRTAPGRSCSRLTINAGVALEIDGATEDEVWSVVVKGRAAEVEGSQREIDEIGRLPLTSWTATPKYRVVQVTPGVDHRPPVPASAGGGPLRLSRAGGEARGVVRRAPESRGGEVRSPGPGSARARRGGAGCRSRRGS
ncbi:pyridoxamine 5'-phosphate oxidase family protein [Rathayibacter oskolensis]|uniref:pyridoxamine 5'-phosphate oxidase family protein n=1 Tax=Rathayibacter oskolensis TaxID=1891671 RepID=UPI0026605495|nr:pyridoxamine 5'-phosphate oxidase family protein [Rathayibacter oskolensis]WKK71296.1 pyridoxamine 5'-phosphate oxidase family protein [Rathayibacter oskolensis]